MKERPILFSAPMVRAILAGAKTQTRRVASGVAGDGPTHPYWPGHKHRGDFVRPEHCPYGAPGDHLWVREAWAGADAMYGNECDPPQTVAYYADASAVVFDGDCQPHAVPQYDLDQWNWSSLRRRPSIHMPRWASRLTLEVTDVCIERLQAISEEGARAEGMGDPPFGTRAESFGCVWDSINGKRAPWSSNPWVWVVTFARVAQAETRGAA